jgi:alanine racemase
VNEFRRTHVEVDLDAIRHNVRTLKPAGAGLMAVVKANGYGHGDLPVARAALEAGATWLGVALVEEGLRLREAGIEAPILVLTEFPAGSEREALAARLTPSLYSDDGLAALAAAPGTPVHVKVDTGMRRVGRDAAGLPEFVRRAVDAGLDFEGLWSHFAVSEVPGHPSVGPQLDAFLAASQALAAAGLVPRLRHMANTGATIAVPQAHFDLVRVGIGTYGLLPGPGLAAMADLRPAMRWSAAVTMVKRVPAGAPVSYGHTWAPERETGVATIGVGYADGFARGLTNVGEVLIRGRRRRVAGTVTMDQILADVGDDPVASGDEVVLLGRQGDEEITADEMAARLGTINYEVVCSVSDRVPRHHVHVT